MTQICGKKLLHCRRRSTGKMQVQKKQHCWLALIQVNICLTVVTVNTYILHLCLGGGGDSHLDDEYRWAGVEDPKIMITTSHDPSSRLKMFVKVFQFSVLIL